MHNSFGYLPTIMEVVCLEHKCDYDCLIGCFTAGFRVSEILLFIISN